jgi:hypothetical protein
MHTRERRRHEVNCPIFCFHPAMEAITIAGDLAVSDRTKNQRVISTQMVSSQPAPGPRLYSVVLL